MIEYLRGTCVHRSATTVIMDVHGVGYEVHISLNTYNTLVERQEARLFIHEVLREDTHDLFGFAEEIERQLFRLLITVNGVGPNTARVMLSTFAPADLAHRIAEGDENALKAIKGIGTKTAQRIIVDLKKRIATELPITAVSSVEEAGSAISGADLELCEEAVKAFVTLGYPAAAARKVVARIVKSEPGVSLNDMIRIGLRMF